MQRMLRGFLVTVVFPCLICSSLTPAGGALRPEIPAAQSGGVVPRWICWHDSRTPDGCKRDLSDVAVFSDSDAWAVGAKGIILHWTEPA